MTTIPYSRWERLGVSVSLLVFLVALTDLAEFIDVAPMWVYLTVLWGIAFLLWARLRFLT